MTGRPLGGCPAAGAPAASPRTSASQRGTGLVTGLAILLGLLVLGVAAAALTASSAEVRRGLLELHAVQASAAAEAGLARTRATLGTLLRAAPLSDPFAAIDALDGEDPFDGPQLLSEGGVTTAQYQVAIEVVAAGPLAREVSVTVTAWAPHRAHADRARRVVRARLDVELAGAEVFEYSYYLSNWGWLYGDDIVVRGNVRALGQLDFGGRRVTVDAQRRYVVDDDGHLGAEIDGGGAYAGWGIVRAEQVRGSIADPAYRHPQSPGLPMPNLTDLGAYEGLARDRGGSVRLGSTLVVSHVLGDDGAEPQNLYLEGTATAPIEVNGPVVVRGSVIIKGRVTGTGTIYAGKHIYVADDLTYVNGPATPRPAGNDRAAIQSWIDDNALRDQLGLFARESVAIGNPDDPAFRSSVTGWLDHANNESREDLGLDGLPNTRRGRDGVLGTADDDVLEGDGVFTVETWSALHERLGLLPPGAEVGDPIPGSGEDVDGDGAFDPRLAVSTLALPASERLDVPGAWAGNVPRGARALGDVATGNIGRVDGAIYTNHAIMARVSSPGDMAFNGSLVSRVEAIIYSVGGRLYMNHDARLLTGDQRLGFVLPFTPRPIRQRGWQESP